MLSRKQKSEETVSNKTTPYDVENPDIGLRQVQTCGEAKPISEIPPDNWISSASHLKKTAIFIYALLMISESLSLTYCLFTLLFPTQHDTEVKQPISGFSTSYGVVLFMFNDLGVGGDCSFC
jgi:hypothetical protein